MMTSYSRGIWQEDEHQRFLDALKNYPRGPWAKIAVGVGTRSARQVQTHAQKYYEKIERHVRGLQRDRRVGVRSRGSDRSVGQSASGSVSREHEIDQEILEACSRALELGERLPTPARPRKTEANVRKASIELSAPLHPKPGGEGREMQSDEEEGLQDELLPLDKSLDFLIELLAGLDDSHANVFWTASPTNTIDTS